MANLTIATGDAPAAKLWSKEIWNEAKKQIFWRRFVGKAGDINCIIQEKEEFKKEAGDKLTFDLIMKLTGAGVTGDNTLEGNEEAPNIYTDSVTIDQIRHAIRLNGLMTEQRATFDMRMKATQLLAIWMAETLEDQYMFRALSGDTTLSFGQAQTAPTATIYGGGKASDATLTTADTFDLTLIDKAVTTAVLASPKIRPVLINGDYYFICVLSPKQVRDMRTNITSGQWLDIQKAISERGIDRSPIARGSLGMYNQTLLFSHEFVQTYTNFGAGANVVGARALFCGAQSAVVAYKESAPSYVEKSFDYSNQTGFKVGRIWGLKKCVFNSKDFGVIVIDTAAA